jgi:hypothetical protein
MAMNKTAGETKAKKPAAKGSSAKKAAPKKAAGAAATKKAAPKKAAAPKLTEPQKAMLEKVAGHTDPAGYHSEKKPDQKVLEALVKHKVAKRGKKHATTKHFHYLVTAAGKKHMASSAASAAGSAPKTS